MKEKQGQKLGLKKIIFIVKNLRIHNVSIHRIFYQNRFINKFVIRKKAKISESQSHGVF